MRGKPSSLPLHPLPSGAARAANGSGALLHLLAEAFEHAAGIYNQTARSKVSLLGPGDGAPPRLTLCLNELGYRFEETPEGNLQVSEIGREGPRAWARIEPQSDPTGRIVGWRECRLSSPATRRVRTADGLSDEYLLGLLRRRLIPPGRSVEPGGLEGPGE